MTCTRDRALLSGIHETERTDDRSVEPGDPKDGSDAVGWRDCLQTILLEREEDGESRGMFSKWTPLRLRFPLLPRREVVLFVFPVFADVLIFEGTNSEKT
jgi:hypothetical protein